MKKILFFLLVLPIIVNAKKEYQADSISPRLTKAMNAVIRDYRCELTINGNHSTEKTKLVITILNANGLQTAKYYNSYDKFNKIKIVSIAYIDSQGKLIRRVSQREVKDYCELDYSTIASDIRFKLFQPNIYHYPFTIKIEYDHTQKESFSPHSWTPYWGESVSIEHASYRITNDSSIHIKYVDYNLEKPKQWMKNKHENLKWDIKNYVPPKDNIFMPDYYEFIPTVLVQQCEYRIGKYKGNANNWQSLGNFEYQLTQQKNTLSESTIQDLKEIKNSTTVTIEKIKKVYEYMQKRTRYVNISFGLGGLLPLPSMIVDKTGWGDCKALTNYTKTLLQTIGIESHAVIINAGENAPGAITNFIASQFNHVILCVPNNTDTTWLECTSQTCPFGFISDFTDNRYCLLLKDKNSYLTKTPKLCDSINKEINNCIVDLKTNGSSLLSTQSQFTGLNYNTFENLNQLNNEDKIKYLGKTFQIPSFKIKDYSIELIKSKIPLAKLHCDLDVQQIGSTMYGTFVFMASLLNKPTFTFVDQERKCNIYIRRGSETLDSITYILPDNFIVKTFPENKKIENQFGRYEIHCQKSENKIQYFRHFTMNSGIFTYETYNSFKKYLLEIEKSDNQRIILEQKRL